MNRCAHEARWLVLDYTVTHPEHRYMVAAICNCIVGLGGCGEQVSIGKSGGAQLVRTRTQPTSRGDEGDGIGPRNSGTVGSGGASFDLRKDSGQDGGNALEHGFHDEGDRNDFARRLNSARTGEGNPAE